MFVFITATRGLVQVKCHGQCSEVRGEKRPEKSERTRREQEGESDGREETGRKVKEQKESMKSETEESKYSEAGKENLESQCNF